MNRQVHMMYTPVHEGRSMAMDYGPTIGCTILITTLIGLSPLHIIRAQAQNVRPVANAGLSRYAGPDPIVLDGTSSYDPDRSGMLDYAWRQASGPPVVMIDGNTATPTIAGSIGPGIGRDTSNKPRGLPQTDEVQECEFELVVSDGDLTSSPATVKLIIVPDFGPTTLALANPPFRQDRPTIIHFGGGDCVTGSSLPSFWIEWQKLANWLYTTSFGPDTHKTESWRTYYRCGDMVIVYLSSVAPDYTGMIQTLGYSTGGQPAVDTAIRLNRYCDPRYAVNHVTELDSPCRSWNAYLEANQLLHSSVVDGETLRHENYWGDTYRLANVPHDFIGIYLEGQDHVEVPNWYISSLTSKTSNAFNHGVVAGAFWSVLGPGKNLQPSPDAIGYYFHLTRQGIMVMSDENAYPGRFPEPVTLVGAIDVGDPNGFVLTCEESENAVGYELLLGTDPYRVIDYEIISDTPVPPRYVIAAIPSDGVWWTIRVRDLFGSTIYADPQYLSMIAYDPDPSDGSLITQTWAILRWSPGLRSASCDVYLSDNFEDVNNGGGNAFRGNQTSTDLFIGLAGLPYPDGLVPGVTYYWRMDGVEADGLTKHKGNVWRLTVSL